MGHSSARWWHRLYLAPRQGAAGNKTQVYLMSRNRVSALHPALPGRQSRSPVSRAARRPGALCRRLAEIWGTHLVYPPAVCSQPRILTRGDDRSAPRTDLPGSTRLVILRIEVRRLPILAVVFLYLALGRILAILRQHALRPLPETLGLLPHASTSSWSPVCPRSQGVSLTSSLTLPLATSRAIPYRHDPASPVLAGIRDSQAVRDLICAAQLAQRTRDTMQPQRQRNPY